MPLITRLTDHWSSLAVGTEFKQFHTELGVSGLCIVEDKKLEILAIHSAIEGHGNMREFFRLAKLEYDEIYVWEIWHQWLKDKLSEYGFYPTLKDIAETTVHGMKWRKNETTPVCNSSTP